VLQGHGVLGQVQGLPSQGSSMNEACAFGPLVRHGGQMWIGEGTWTWNEDNTKEKENPT
jgi:hypothetical protein